MQSFASQRNRYWKFISKEYKNQSTYYKWYCELHVHEWDATYKSLKRGAHKGCKYCWVEEKAI